MWRARRPSRMALRIIRAIAENAVRTVPWSPSLALERRNRIDERQRFLRIMTVGTGQTDRERHGPTVADYMAFAPSLSPVGWIWTRLRSTTHCSHGATIHDRPRPIDLVMASQPIQHRKMNAGSDSFEFRLLYRTKYLKSFLPARRLERCMW
jgi:hypothetical protein